MQYVIIEEYVDKDDANVFIYTIMNLKNKTKIRSFSTLAEAVEFRKSLEFGMEPESDNKGGD